MDFWVGVSGAWKKVTGPHVGVSSSHKAWKGAWIGVGGVWKQFYQALEVNTVASVTTSIPRGTGVGTVYSVLQLRDDGDEAINSSATGATANSVRGQWLAGGLPADVWVERTINSGTLDLDPGSGRLQMNADRTFRVSRARTLIGTTSANITLDFYDASSGGNLLGSSTLTLSVQVTA